MNNRPHNEHLLNDVLAEETPAHFRDALLNQTLGLARRRRHIRRVRLAAFPLALILSAFLLVWHAGTPTRPYELVRTQPLPPEAVLGTRPLPSDSVVTSRPTAIIATATTRSQILEINDEELLDLAAPNPVVLVRYSPHEAELVFADSDASN
jgi:hypothetical protein